MIYRTIVQWPSMSGFEPEDPGSNPGGPMGL